MIDASKQSTCKILRTCNLKVLKKHKPNPRVRKVSGLSENNHHVGKG